MLKLRVCANHLKSLSLSAASTRALSTHTPSIGITRPQSSSSAASKTPSSTASFEQDEEYDHMKAYTDGKKSYTTSCSEYHLVPSTIREVLEQSAKDHDRKMVYGFPHQGLNLSFSEVQQRVNLLAQNLLELGFRKGDRLAISLPNTYELVITFLAASEIGLISVILNPAYQVSEFEYMLKKSGARGLVIYDSFKTLQHMEIMRRLCPEIDHSEPGQLSSKTLPDLKHVFVLNSPLVPTKSTYKGTWDFSRLLEKSQRNEKHILPYVDIDDPCLILFTSGTTGKPKGALMSHSNLLNSAYLSTVVVGKREGLRMICNPVPFFHIFGLSTGVLIPLLMGTSIVFPFYFPETLSSMKAIQGYKCNTMRGTPTQFVDVINHPEREKLNISSLENGIIGASTVPPDLLQKMKNVLNLKEIIVGYGMTETSLCHSVTTYTDKLKSHKYAYESIGRPIPFSETKIVDSKTGHIVPLGVDGEVCIRGPHIIKEYWDEKEKTAQAIDENGWLHTGDVCCMDSDGYLYFKSRDKDIIIRGGANLYPAEIESFIRTHPEIVDAQVFGVPDERLGEEISIWIKLKPNSKLTEEDIKAFCKDKISHFKVPKYYKFVEQFPTNANNKMLKNVMREKMIAELKL